MFLSHRLLSTTNSYLSAGNKSSSTDHVADHREEDEDNRRRTHIVPADRFSSTSNYDEPSTIIFSMGQEGEEKIRENETEDFLALEEMVGCDLMFGDDREHYNDNDFDPINITDKNCINRDENNFSVRNNYMSTGTSDIINYKNMSPSSKRSRKFSGSFSEEEDFYLPKKKPMRLDRTSICPVRLLFDDEHEDDKILNEGAQSPMASVCNNNDSDHDSRRHHDEDNKNYVDRSSLPHTLISNNYAGRSIFIEWDESDCTDTSSIHDGQQHEDNQTSDEEELDDDHVERDLQHNNLTTSENYARIIIQNNISQNDTSSDEDSAILDWTFGETAPTEAEAVEFVQRIISS